MTEATRKFPAQLHQIGLRREWIDNKCFLPEVVEQRLAAIERFRFAGGDDEELCRGCGFRAPEHWSGDEMLPHRVMGLGQYLGKSHGDRTHRQMDRVFTQRLDDASATENDLLHRIVVGEHRDNDVALARACRAARDFRPFVPQFLGSAPSAVVDEDAMARLQEVTRHRLPNSPEANKPDFHRVSAPSSRCHCVFELSGNSGN